MRGRTPSCDTLHPSAALGFGFCRFVGAVRASAQAMTVPIADNTDAMKALISVIKKEEITINVDLGEKIPVSVSRTHVASTWSDGAFAGDELVIPARIMLPTWGSSK